MSPDDVSATRDAYVEAFNAGDLERISGLLSEDAEYRWELEGRVERGREAVMKLYEMGHRAYQGRSRLSAVPATSNQAIWWQPGEGGLEPAGLQTLEIRNGLIAIITDSHSAERVSEAARGMTPPT